MALFQKLYDRALIWSRHRRAPWFLGGLSFAESTFFPIPPDVMLLPMMLARPKRVWQLAALCTIASVVGGLVGWMIGKWAFQWIEPWLTQSSYQAAFQQAMNSFERWGFWFILVAGFSPIPYKVFTISAGVAGMPWIPFLTGSLIGRGGRFFLEAAVIRIGGERAAERLRQWVDILGWMLVIIILAVIAYVKLKPA